jgi:hypothetical protein
MRYDDSDTGSGRVVRRYYHPFFAATTGSRPARSAEDREGSFRAYPSRKAMIGLTRAARVAGTQAASAATVNTKTAAAR